ncbi:putative methyltransferase YcgJ [Clostridium ragsdalei P11]|uniref:Putative methyltransferase YcgJ n=1 Tax=Clostridium ragsdalei P11 TaxID=1353534 RepID=A0A1A6B4D3_9CLOT|nr:class I SAM-dependent methyltransferase [Clostridium ragsdalei]OBR97206.1 putative methyltransferase YcgJ [Clostridium ragsdalei P11]
MKSIYDIKLFVNLYDCFMRKIMFPRCFNTTIETHMGILKNELKDIHGKKVLELAAGTGSTAEVLPIDNSYIGTDVSIRMLNIAKTKFKKMGFQNIAFEIADACNLKFEAEYFDLIICNLAMTYFINIDDFVDGLYRILRQGGEYLCSVPISQNNGKKKYRINEKIATPEKIKDLFVRYGLAFETLKKQAGELLYFKAYKIA